MTEPTGGLKILLVEDDARTARRLGQMLDEDGYQTELAFDGAAAIARLGLEPALDVLIVDYMVPHLSGIGIANYARSRQPSLPVIVISSYQEVVSHLRPALAQPVVMLPKPLAYADLIRVLSEMRARA